MTVHKLTDELTGCADDAIPRPVVDAIRVHLDPPPVPEKEVTTFVPSQVDVTQIFVGTFDHVEAENTAAVIVKVLAMNGDTWRPATCEELAAGFTKLTHVPGLWRSRFNNPFMRIDMHDLVDRGFAEWDGEKAIKFTDKGLLRMEKWVRQAC